jgi:hypothetical protein
MSILGDLSKVYPFRAPEPPAAAIAKKELVIEVPWYDRFLTSGPAAWLDQTFQKTDATLASAGGIAGTAAAVNSGLKWGLILGAALLALFIIAQVRQLSVK